jgi:dihydroorotase
MTDLILRGGRVVDPASGRDETADVGFTDGRVKAVGPDLPGRGAEIVDARGLLVVPGLIDLHTHTYIGAAPPSGSMRPTSRGRAEPRLLLMRGVPAQGISMVSAVM